MLTAERLRTLLTYKPETGIFYIAAYRGGRKKVGEVAGAVNSSGYVCIKVDGRKYQAHRLAWLYTHGEWPPDVIDHINGSRTDNRLCNLRCATRRENKHNSNAPSVSTSGVKGVFWNSKRRKWQARICLPNGKRRHLGYHHFLSDAEEVVTAAYSEVHGQFAKGSSE